MPVIRHPTGSFENCNEAATNDGEAGRHGVAPHALDPESAQRLWELAVELAA